MRFLSEYFTQNYVLLIMLGGMLILSAYDVYLEKKMIYMLRVALCTLLALSVFEWAEEIVSNLDHRTIWRVLFSAVCYSLRPIIILQIICLVTKKMNKIMMIPAVINVLLSFSALFSSVVFSFTSDNYFQRGPLGYSAYVISVFYVVGLLVVSIRSVPKHSQEESVFVFFLAFAAIGAAIMAYEGFDEAVKVTYAAEILLYYLYTYGQFTKRDTLTGLYNRQSFYGDIEKSSESIGGVISIDMNELKWLNDTLGHSAGDKALKTVSDTFVKYADAHGRIYRIGGDEFVIFCRKRFVKDMEKTVEKMRKSIDDAGYSCAFGISSGKSVTDMIHEADEKMYQDKARIKSEMGTGGKLIHFRD
ncbi:MAG: GGDEF domain-containing protein [Lachnospiraceae bacterium]|nr:GGDEF domain-containing protein [Lachnospiraceae bacterium]